MNTRRSFLKTLTTVPLLPIAASAAVASVTDTSVPAIASEPTYNLVAQIKIHLSGKRSRDYWDNAIWFNAAYDSFYAKNVAHNAAVFKGIKSDDVLVFTVWRDVVFGSDRVEDDRMTVHTLAFANNYYNSFSWCNSENIDSYTRDNIKRIKPMTNVEIFKAVKQARDQYEKYEQDKIPFRFIMPQRILENCKNA
jgi:hypothetical protein